MKKMMTKIKIYKNYNLAPLTTFKIGGKAQFYCEPKTVDHLKEAIKIAKDKSLEIFIIGGGSNLLISDHGLKGFVICTKKMNKCKIIDDYRLVADTGVTIKNVNQFLLKKSLSGLEFTGGLPGSIGGAVFMNARAYNKQMSDVVESVKAIRLDGFECELKKDELDFAYKQSFFMTHLDYIIVQVNLQLQKGIYKDIKAIYLKNYFDRKNKKQFDYPSAGCVFKNDYDTCTITGKLIDELGLRGKRIGGAQIALFHGNFIINTDKAKADDVLKLIEFIEKTVYDAKGINLKREIVLLGF